jgi:hypothetical protein
VLFTCDCNIHLFSKLRKRRFQEVLRGPRPPGIGIQKSSDILPILLDKKNLEMSLFDLQNISFLVFDRGGEAHKPDFNGGLVK